MYGQSRDHESDSITGSRSGPAFFQSPSPSKKKNQRSSEHEKEHGPTASSGAAVNRQVPIVGSTLLAVYEREHEFRAGILLVDEVTLPEESAIHRSAQCDPASDAVQEASPWLLKVAELRLESEHLTGQALQWKPGIELSSDQLLFTEVLTCKLKSEHVAACRQGLSRLHAVAKMLELSRDGE